MVSSLAPVRVGPGVAVEGALVVRTALSPGWALEAELSYATGSLRANGGGQDRSLSDLRVVGGSVRVRRAWRGIEAAAGVGGLSYDAPDAHAYSDGAPVHPAAVLGAGVPFLVAGRQIRLEATARVHRHQTPVLERAGADGAIVVRGGLHVGLALGEPR